MASQRSDGAPRLPWSGQRSSHVPPARSVFIIAGSHDNGGRHRMGPLSPALRANCTVWCVAQWHQEENGMWHVRCEVWVLYELQKTLTDAV